MQNMKPRQRGFACIGLVNPKTPANIGSAMRACGVYGASLLAYTGQRVNKGRAFITDTQKAYRHIPMLNPDNLRESIPFDCIPVAVDFVDGAKSLCDFKHPLTAMYIFGPEDGTLGKDITDWCRHKVYIPTNGCMNLAATVNVVLYDRFLKREKGK